MNRIMKNISNLEIFFSFYRLEFVENNQRNIENVLDFWFVNVNISNN